MGRGDAARGRPRGGEDIPALRPSRARLALGAAAVAGELALAVLALARGSDIVLRVGVRLSAVAVVVLVGALALGRPRLVPLSLALLGACYALHLGVDDPPLDVAAAVFAAGLFLTAELAYWSLDEREGVHAETQEAFRRTAIVALLGAGTLLVSAAVLALADIVRARGVALDIAGAAAAAGALLIVVLAGRTESPGD